METLADRLTVTSPTFPVERLRRILREAKPFDAEAHVLYPADERGQHLEGFFSLEPVVRNAKFVTWIQDDLVTWLDHLDVNVDVLFAPDQAPVRALGDVVAKAAGLSTAYWEALPSGRFGTHLVDGAVERGDRVLVFNGVSHTGRCVGERLPEFVEGLGGTAVAAAVFVKGTVPKVHEVEARMGERFYSALQADVPIYASSDCPMCRGGKVPLVLWTELPGRETP